MSAPPKILVVDDSRVSRMMTTTIIRQRFPDALLVEAGDGCDALNQMMRTAFDLAILDLNMPGLSGMDVACAARQDHPAIRLAILTANVQSASRQRAEQMGIKFFSKPITQSVIYQILDLLDGDRS